MEISGNTADLQQLRVFAILAIIGQVFLLFLLSWNTVAIIVCIILDVLLLVAGLIDWFYFSKKVLLDGYGCAFAWTNTTKRFAWEEIYLQQTENASFLFGDSETPGEGIILSAKPISKPTLIGAMTYCRLFHPRRSVFIRFTSSSDKQKKTPAKFVYRGFIANKEDVLKMLKMRKTGDGSMS